MTNPISRIKRPGSRRPTNFFPVLDELLKGRGCEINVPLFAGLAPVCNLDCLTGSAGHFDCNLFATEAIVVWVAVFGDWFLFLLEVSTGV